MAAIFSTLLRGLAGVAGVVALVAITWTVYIHRDAVASALEPVTSLLGGPDEAPSPTAAPLARPGASPESAAATSPRTEPGAPSTQ